MKKKTSEHPYFKTGSPTGYLVDGVEGAELTLQVGKTYLFSVDGMLYFTDSSLTNPSCMFTQILHHNIFGWIR